MTRTILELASLSPNFLAIPAGRHLAPTDLACTRPAYTAVFRWKRVSNLEPSGPEVETLSPGHRGLKYLIELMMPVQSRRQSKFGVSPLINKLMNACIHTRK
ncbi:hypothetical protein AVEN_175989-1 [Araneus ventricosus]|uniref:Uncharacterized protein n=1 Tax=Araneus ventricosus TaxID=182803 RepID=A0A4Y2EKF4_ARAVE|nr:hypothetical protein AVEN_175989-1 [Araneus ventricosus]